MAGKRVSCAWNFFRFIVCVPRGGRRTFRYSQPTTKHDLKLIKANLII